VRYAQRGRAQAEYNELPNRWREEGARMPGVLMPPPAARNNELVLGSWLIGAGNAGRIRPAAFVWRVMVASTTMLFAEVRVAPAEFRWSSRHTRRLRQKAEEAEQRQATATMHRYRAS